MGFITKKTIHHRRCSISPYLATEPRWSQAGLVQHIFMAMNLEDNSDYKEITIINFHFSPSVLFWFPCPRGKGNKLCATCCREGNEGISAGPWFKFCKQTLSPRVITLRGCSGIKVLSIKQTQGPTSADFFFRDLLLCICVSRHELHRVTCAALPSGL